MSTSRGGTRLKTLIETKGTLFYGLHTPDDQIIETLALLAEGMRISSVSRVKGYKPDTISSWPQAAAHHAEAIEEILLSTYELKRAQIDALWSYVGNRGEKKAIVKGR